MESKKLNIAMVAKEFAREKHSNIFFLTTSGYRKPQFEHLQEVADLVWASGGSDNEIAAAWLHDSIEDTDTVLETVDKIFGKEIADLVYGLTDAEDLKDLPTLERKTKQSERIKTKSESARKIKIADQISNIRTVVLDAPNGWADEKNRSYVIGAKLIVDQCKGINTILDNIFDQEYAKAAIHLNI